MGVAYLKRTPEHVDEELVCNDVEFLLIFTLNVGLSNSFTPGIKEIIPPQCAAAAAALSLSLSSSLSLSLHTHRLANPALRTAVEMALMAVSRELSSMVREPVEVAIFLCSLRTNRVSVIVSTLISSMAGGGGAAMVN